MKIDYKQKKILSQEAQEQQNLKYILKSSSLIVQGHVIETEKDIESLETKLASLKTSYPLKVEEIANTYQELENAKAGLKFLNDLKEELGL